MLTIKTIRIAIAALTIGTAASVTTIANADEKKHQPKVTQHPVKPQAQNSVIAVNHTRTMKPGTSYIVKNHQSNNASANGEQKQHANLLPKTDNHKRPVDGAVKPVNSNQSSSTQKVTGVGGTLQGITNMISGGIKIARGKVDEGVSQAKHGAEQVKASTDGDPSNNPGSENNNSSNNNSGSGGNGSGNSGSGGGSSGGSGK